MVDKDYVCEDWGETTQWTQIRVTVKLEQLDALVAVMSMINTNLMIEDYSDIDLKTCYGDLIDESILNADKTIASVSVYLPVERDIREDVEFLREMLAKDGIEGEIKMIGLNEEDWANAWKAYYKPIKIGQRMVIVPAWEKYQAEEHELIVRMDPGMAFGTGTHETTRLVIGLLEKYTTPGVRMLDVGTGSGILAICASKLGAGECKAYDIDPMSVRVANENVKDSDLCDVVTVAQSDLLKQAENVAGGYNIICANIVADIIIRMTPDVSKFMNKDTVLLASGIISERRDDVVSCFEEHGLRIVELAEENGWCALAVSLK